jgi:hypothetical protein
MVAAMLMPQLLKATPQPKGKQFRLIFFKTLP